MREAPANRAYQGACERFPDGRGFPTGRAAFYEALDDAGLGHLSRRPKPIVFHDLRHKFGTLAVQVFPLSDVRAYMGRQDISTTMIYVHAAA